MGTAPLMMRKRIRKPTITEHPVAVRFKAQRGERVCAFWAEDERGASGSGVMRLRMQDGQLVLEVFHLQNVVVIER